MKMVPADHTIVSSITAASTSMENLRSNKLKLSLQPSKKVEET
jgi:hypothetical protein